MEDLTQLAQEYLREAAALKRRVDTLRQALRRASCSERNELNRRIAMLYTMYLECRHTGLLLSSHPARQWEGGDAHADKAAQL